MSILSVLLVAIGTLVAAFVLLLVYVAYAAGGIEKATAALEVAIAAIEDATAKRGKS